MHRSFLLASSLCLLASGLVGQSSLTLQGEGGGPPPPAVVVSASAARIRVRLQRNRAGAGAALGGETEFTRVRGGRGLKVNPLSGFLAVGDGKETPQQMAKATEEVAPSAM